MLCCRHFVYMKYYLHSLCYKILLIVHNKEKKCHVGMHKWWLGKVCFAAKYNPSLFSMGYSIDTWDLILKVVSCNGVNHWYLCHLLWFLYNITVWEWRHMIWFLVCNKCFFLSIVCGMLFQKGYLCKALNYEVLVCFSVYIL